MLRDLFIRFRRSNAFLVALVSSGIIAASCHYLLGFDPEWTLCNLLLSAEASVASCMILDQQFRAAENDRGRWDRIERELLDVAEEVSHED